MKSKASLEIGPSRKELAERRVLLEEAEGHERGKDLDLRYSDSYTLHSMSIEILPNEVVDQIAAGEVVERPSHLVKELVENALDAQATEIEVAVWQGGRKVKVTDNGIGMSKEDLAKACLRHATSKVRDTEDLWRLKSFGFRGEALSSIGSVSRMTMVSQQEGSEASSIRCDFGQISKASEGSGSRGTQILIEDLFENVPARLKFLKSAGAEIGQIRQTLKAIALVHPQLQLRFLVEGRLEAYWTASSSLKSRVEQVLEQKELFDSSKEIDGFRAEIVFSAPQHTFRTSKNLWFFAQDRWVQDRSLHAAVMDAYRSLLMHGEYPLAVVRISGPPEQIDVNVHPSKSQIKFENPSKVFQLVQKTLREALERAPWVSFMQKETEGEFFHGDSSRFEKSENFHGKDSKVQQPSFQQPSFQQPSFHATQFRQKLEAREGNAPRLSLEDFASLASHRDSVLKTGIHARTEFRSEGHPDSESSSETRFWGHLQVLGQAHLTYILAQSSSDFFLIDQHAAQERILYEKIWQQWQKGTLDVQRYLLPLLVDLAPEEVEALDPFLPDFQRLGVEVERAGPQTLAITSAPIWLKESSLGPALLEAAKEVLELGGSFVLEKKIRDLAATMACHSAIRAGQSLSLSEMKALLEQMDEFSFSTFCPHGRPVYLKWSFAQIERDFGRLG